MDGTRSALIVASSDYTDAGLRQLRSPASDAQALAEVLADPGIGGFEVRTLLNKPAHEISLEVEEFFAERRLGDLLLVHFSCHGVKDEGGELHFAMPNTLLRRLGATAVAANFVNRCMARTRARRVVLLLDCCYAGAFERGMIARAGEDVGINAEFGGRGRAVITASSAMEYAFEGGELADVRTHSPSVFTSALVEGLKTGDADRDQDGFVALDELYDYVYEKVRAATPNQTPGKWTFGIQGDLVIARRSRPITTPAPLEPELQYAIESPLAAIRAAAVQELTPLLHAKHAGRALRANLELKKLTEDDSRRVADAAAAALGVQTRLPGPPRLELSTTLVNFGRLTLGSKAPECTIRLRNAGGGSLNARTVSSPRWLQISLSGDDLVFGVDAKAVGEHEDVVLVESDGGSATIRVQVRIDKMHQHDQQSATTNRPKTVPAAPESARSAEAESVKRAHDSTNDENSKKILTELVRNDPRSGSYSAANIAARTGLSQSAVSTAMHQLHDAGWVNVVSTSQSRELQFSLSDNRGLVIGMSLSRDHVCAVLTSLRTSPGLIAQYDRRLPETSPRKVVRTLMKLTQELRENVGPGQDIVGLGVAMPGYIDGGTGTVHSAPDLQTDSNRWFDFPFAAELQEATSLKTVVENDANALAVHEYLLQGNDQNVAVVLMSGSGESIGFGFVLNGFLYEKSGMTGEIGHIVVDPEGAYCQHGVRGCLEAVASTTAILTSIKHSTATTIESLDEASALVEGGNAVAANAFANAGIALGRVLTVVTAIIGPQRLVIVGPPQLTRGPEMASAGLFLEGVRRELGHVMLTTKVEAVTKALAYTTLASAAATTVVHHLLSRPSQWAPETLLSPSTAVSNR